MSSRSSSIIPLPIHPCPLWSLFTLHVILLVFSIALLSIGSRLRSDSASVQKVSGYTKANCTLTAVQVNMCPMGAGYVAVYRRSEDGGSSVVSDPFAFRANREDAERHFNDYAFNVTLPCMCNRNYMDPYPALTCAMNDACMMDVRMVEYMQTVSSVYGVSAFCFLCWFYNGSLKSILAIPSLPLVHF